MILPFLTIAPSENRGRGVFTTEFIASGTTIEIAPVIVFDAIERVDLEKTKLYNYIFEWGEDYTGAAVGLGYVSIYNHAQQANCKYEMDFENEQMSIVTLRDIQVGEELFINYNADNDSEQQVWFNAV
jgi:SET domain-containing protein